MKLSVFLIPVFAGFCLSCAGQDTGPQGRPDMDFGTVTPSTFAPVVYSIDSTANAVVLFDHGEVNFDPSYANSRAFSYILERHTRIRLLNKNAFNLANFTLSTLRKSSMNPPYIESFKGATYNLEDGKLVVTKVDKSNIFKDQNGEFNQEKVVFPNVKEGSVIEYIIRIVYTGAFIPPWTFQGGYPVLWSEYDVTVPTLYDYAVKHQGYQKYVVDSTVFSSAEFPVSFNAFIGTWSGQTIRRIWALQNIPALERPEPYTTTLANHLSLISFQLSAIRMNGYNKTYRSNWNELVDELSKMDKFGSPLTDRNHWVDDELKNITTGLPASQRSLAKIYAYVRDHFDCSNKESIYMTQPLKKVWEDKRGNVADLNLLLTVLCRHAGFEASPVILSTRTHGLAVDDYPLLNDYNYVICRVSADGNTYLLDASKPYLGFGQLPEICYNGWARVIDNTLDKLPLFSDSVTEKRTTQLILANTDSGYAGTYTRRAGIFESMDLRQRMKRETPDQFFQSLEKTMADYKQMGSYGFDSLASPDQPVSWHYTMKYNFTRKTIYFNPILHERFNNNPFNAAIRHYPVEMPFCIDNTYMLNMEVPKGYSVDQLPKSTSVKLEDSTGLFTYDIRSDGKMIRFRTRLQIRKAYYSLDEYQGLRDFFSFIVGKEQEPIVLKKID
jgi:hypothetical protein